MREIEQLPLSDTLVLLHLSLTEKLLRRIPSFSTVRSAVLRSQTHSRGRCGSWHLTFHSFLASNYSNPRSTCCLLLSVSCLWPVSEIVMKPNRLRLQQHNWDILPRWWQVMSRHSGFPENASWDWGLVATSIVLHVRTLNWQEVTLTVMWGVPRVNPWSRLVELLMLLTYTLDRETFRTFTVLSRQKNTDSFGKETKNVWFFIIMWKVLCMCGQGCLNVLKSKAAAAAKVSVQHIKQHLHLAVNAPNPKC